MKISKKSLLTTSGIFTVASLGLMFLSASAQNDTNQLEVGTDPNNAIQHFEKVKIIPVDDDSYAFIKKIGGIIGIDTDYNFLLTGETENTIESSVRRSSILGGKNNKIQSGFNEVILGGINNKISTGESNSILGGSGNEITDGENLVIFGGKDNNIHGNNSVIIGGEGNLISGENSTVIGNHNQVIGNNSIAMGSGAYVKGENSFLWTDGKLATLHKDNVFAIKGEHGMVVNTNKAHDFAQLTIGGSLVISSGDEAPTCDSNTKGVIKAINNDNCLCSCDGSGRNSLHGGAMCDFLCSGEEPKAAICDNDSGNRDCETYTYTGRCTQGTVVQGTGAFFVSTENGVNFINWSCQSDTGAIVPCRTQLDNNGCDNHDEDVTFVCTGAKPEHATFVADTDLNLTYNVTNRAYLPESIEKYGYKCAYTCDPGYFLNQYTNKCEECPGGTDKYDPDTNACEGMIVCEDGLVVVPKGNGSKEFECISPKGSCTLNNNSSYTNYNFLDNTNISNYQEIIPSTINQTGVLECIDGDQYNGEFSEHSCSYQCKPGYYCKKTDNNTPAKCTQPVSCDWDEINEKKDGKGLYTNPHYNETFTHTGGCAGNYNFNTQTSNSSPISAEQIATLLASGIIVDNNTYNSGSIRQADVKYLKSKLPSHLKTTGAIVDYLRNLDTTSFNNIFSNSSDSGFSKCVYRCSEGFRKRTDNRTGDAYFCVDYSNAGNQCKATKFTYDYKYKNSIKINAFLTGNIRDNDYKYTGARDRLSKNQRGCYWSCNSANGYQPIEGREFRDISAKTLFNRNLNSKICYKPCGSGEYLQVDEEFSLTYYLYNNSTGQYYGCISCQGGSEPDPTTKQTTTISGHTYSEYRGCTCTQQNMIWNKTYNSCYCIGGNMINSGGKCECKDPIMHYDTGKNECVCPSGLEYDLGKCVCKNHYLGYVYNTGTKKCECDINKGLKYGSNDGEHYGCYTCIDDKAEYKRYGRCECNDPSKTINPENGKCESCNTSKGFTGDGIGGCECEDPYKRNINGRCSCDTDRGFHTTTDRDNQCICEDTSIVNVSTKTCECKTNSGHRNYKDRYVSIQPVLTGEIDNKICSCDENKGLKYIRNIGCVCSDPNKRRDGEKCASCPSDRIVNGNSCICNPNYFETNNGECICPFHKDKGAVTEAIKQDGICKCDGKGLTFSKGIGCVCNTNKGFTGDGNGGCTCKNGTVLSGNQCVNICDSSQGLTGDGIGGCICNTSRGFKAGTGPCTCDNPRKRNENGSCVCNSSLGFTSDGYGSCKCQGNTQEIGSEENLSCECPFINEERVISPTKNGNYCTCYKSNQADGELIYSAGIGCVCNENNGFYYSFENKTCAKSSSCAPEHKHKCLTGGIETVICRDLNDNTFRDENECRAIDKSLELQVDLTIENRKDSYISGDKINYKLKITNIGNWVISGKFTYKIYLNDKVKTDVTFYDGELETSSTLQHTGDILLTNDLINNILQTNTTGNLTISIELEKEGITIHGNRDSETVIISKTTQENNPTNKPD